MRAICISLVLGALALSGCTSHRPASPYTVGSEEARNPSKADQLNQKACDQLGKDPRAAEALLRQALAADLYHGPAHNNLGTLLLQQGKLYEAAGEFEWAKKLLPGHPDPRLNLALTLEKAGRTDDAIANYKGPAARGLPRPHPVDGGGWHGYLQVRVGKDGRRDSTPCYQKWPCGGRPRSGGSGRGLR